MVVTKHCSTRKIALLAIVLAAIQPLTTQSASESDRLEKLERAVEQLQKRNADLEAEVSTLKKQQVAVVPEGKMKTKIISDGKTYVEKVVEEKPPIYVQQRGSEIKLGAHRAPLQKRARTKKTGREINSPPGLKLGL